MAVRQTIRDIHKAVMTKKDGSIGRSKDDQQVLDAPASWEAFVYVSKRVQYRSAHATLPAAREAAQRMADATRNASVIYAVDAAGRRAHVDRVLPRPRKRP